MRGSTPLDVAAASVMDNNELALALREPDLEKVRLTHKHTLIVSGNMGSCDDLGHLYIVISVKFKSCSVICHLIFGSPVQVVQYLAGCGLQSCIMLVHEGYPDIGWNPVEGERYLDFLRFAVFCNGENSLSSLALFVGALWCFHWCLCVQVRAWRRTLTSW